MKNVTILKIATAVILALIACHISYYWDKLPDTVVSHFDANWEPNGWMPRNIFMYTYIGLAGLISLSFLGVIPLLHKIPIRYINLPKREYWLAPERKDLTIAELSVSMFRLHNLTQTFILATMHLVIQYNIDKKPISSDVFWTLFVMYMAYMAYWTIMLIVKYTRVPEKA